MLKTVKIGRNNYDMKSSAWTPFKYENEYQTEFLGDINKINKKAIEIGKLPVEEQQTAWLDEITGIFKTILQIAYTMIKENNNNFKSYEEWLKELDGIYQEAGWIEEVLECAMSTFQGRVEIKQPQ